MSTCSSELCPGLYRWGQERTEWDVGLHPFRVPFQQCHQFLRVVCRVPVERSLGRPAAMAFHQSSFLSKFLSTNGGNCESKGILPWPVKHFGGSSAAQELWRMGWRKPVISGRLAAAVSCAGASTPFGWPKHCRRAGFAQHPRKQQIQGQQKQEEGENSFL